MSYAGKVCAGCWVSPSKDFSSTLAFKAWSRSDSSVFGKAAFFFLNRLSSSSSSRASLLYVASTWAVASAVASVAASVPASVFYYAL